VAVLIVAAVVATLVARGVWWFAPLASEHGAQIDRLFLITFVIISIAFVLVHGLLALFIWRYRDRGERAAYWHDHRTLELAYTIVPAIVLLILTLMAARLWAQVHSPAPEGALVVDVRAEQFAWRARYPGPDGRLGRINARDFNARTNPLALDRADPAGRDDIVATELHLAVNRPAEIRLRAKDVLHSFFVPAFRFKQDAVPGITINTWFVPTKPGRYEIACAELCGAGHYIMRGTVVVETQEQLNAWLAGGGKATRP
jgi:cytochrome c oxidase subunit 2